MKISELKPQQKQVSLKKVRVMEISPVKKFQQMGAPGKVCNALIKDDSGKVSLTLWNDEISKVKEGDRLEIENATVKEWQGYLQLNMGRKGTFKVLKK